MKNILRHIKREFQWAMKFIVFIFKNLKYIVTNKKRIILFGSPLYKNLGDVAINLSELQLLNDNFNVDILEIPYELAYKHVHLFKLFVKNNVVLIIGGGFIGTAWIDSEIFIRNIILNYKSNSVIIMPQTAFFDDDIEYEKTKEIYKSHKDLIVFAREENSYKILKEMGLQTFLVPDSVLYYNSFFDNNDRSGILLCMRDDSEKITPNIEKLLKYIKKYIDNDIMFIDNNNCKKITFSNRKTQFIDRIKLFSLKKIIITDRLHGMIFGVLSGSVTIAFDNKTKKISNVYKWLKKQKNVVCVSNIDDAIDFLNHVEIKNYTFSGLKKEFTPLIDVIKDKLYE